MRYAVVVQSYHDIVSGAPVPIFGSIFGNYFSYPGKGGACLSELSFSDLCTKGIGPIPFLHVRSPEADALPLLLTHGWPGSIVEYLDVIAPLTDPRSHGGDPFDAFHLVIPSIPNFGLSGPTTDAGWNVERVAAAFAMLMRWLGYGRYGAQGGDWGAFVSAEIGKADREHVVGVHVNAATYGFIPWGEVPEQERLKRLKNYYDEGSGYFQVGATRPQTISYALNDSPAGQLAWIVEKFKEWTFPESELPEQAIDRDRMLTNVAIYWLTSTGASSAQVYYGGMHSSSWGSEPPTTPTGVAVFAEDVAICRYREQANNIVHWTDFDRGGHFAAMEVPDLFASDVRTFFRTLR